METLGDIQWQSMVLWLTHYKPNKNRFSDVDALPNHKLITNADMNLFQRLANSPQSKLLNEYGVAYDNI